MEGETESDKSRRSTKVEPREHPALTAIRRRISSGSRQPFQSALSEALHGMPRASDWRALGETKPHLWAQGLRHLAELAGYVQQQHVTTTQVSAPHVAAELVRRYGVERARSMLEAAGLPTTLAVEAADSVVLEHAPVQAPIDKE